MGTLHQVQSRSGGSEGDDSGFEEAAVMDRILSEGREACQPTGARSSIAAKIFFPLTIASEKNRGIVQKIHAAFSPHPHTERRTAI
jgi:hypothetical protein